MIKDLVLDFPEKAELLAKAFWPGALTIVVKKSNKISNIVSGGLDSVGIRIPSNETARKIIKLANVPLCAPSANVSGSPSPTSASHVLNDLNGKIPLIIDDGNCEVGVESTVVSVFNEKIVLLRPGGISLEQLKSIVGEVFVDDAVLQQLEENVKPASPGMKYKHYSPKAKIVIVNSNLQQFNEYLKTQKDPFALVFDGEETPCPKISYGAINDSNAQAKLIFSKLRELDELGAKTVFARCPNKQGVGLAVYNRLIRAASFEEISL
jgi:L-threonylcarbamoyladenylate synthase